MDEQIPTRLQQDQSTPAIFQQSTSAAKELPAHRAPSHLPAYDGTSDPAEHIHKFENAALLHKYTDGIKSHVFLITLTNSAQQWIKQEDNKTLRAYIQRFNKAILEVPTAHQEVLVNAFTQGLRGGPLFESLAKKSAIDFLDVLAQTGKYMNLEDAWLMRKSSHDRWRENELSSSNRSRGEPEGCLNPLDP
ncbi:UNVERIFIED_CONTAM: hypothetical protein Slati_3955000 [Sesamum latifolium]|uniref:Retrotransposon gag domain-containing protein n=1 Tax=Sesamum latifolium TaxID=2727402 RepID=A0AAW2TS20_9LAMI